MAKGRCDVVWGAACSVPVTLPLQVEDTAAASTTINATINTTTTTVLVVVEVSPPNDGYIRFIRHFLTTKGF